MSEEQKKKAVARLKKAHETMRKGRNEAQKSTISPRKG